MVKGNNRKAALAGAMAVLIGWSTAGVSAAADVTLKIRFGLKDKEGKDWSGKVEVKLGRIQSIAGLRFAGEDAASGNTWTARTRPAPKKPVRSNNAAKAEKLAKQAPVRFQDNGVAVKLSGVEEKSLIAVKTAQGDFDFSLADAPFAGVLKALGGAVEVRRFPSARGLTAGGPDDDYPALAVAGDGTVYAAYVSFTPGLDRAERLMPLNKAPKDFSYLATPPGGDQVWLRVRGNEGFWGAPKAVTGKGRDVYRCAAAADGSEALWVVWSEKRGDNFDVWTRAWQGGSFDKPRRLTKAPGNDISPVAATDGNGRVWVAWQGAAEGRFGIYECHQTAAGDWSAPRKVSHQATGNCWVPSIAGDRRERGGVAIGWDTYEEGDYDVWVREFGGDGGARDPAAAAATERFEANSSLAYDGKGRLWVAWEIGGPMWAKDYGTDAQGDGVPLDLDRQVGLRVLADGEWKAAPAGHVDALPTKGEVRMSFAPPPPDKIGSAHTRPPKTGGVFNKIGNICCDGEDRVWLAVRNRAGGSFRDCVGLFWDSAVCYFDGRSWVGPIALPNSGDVSHKRPALTAAPEGGGALCPSDGLSRHAEV